LTILPRSKLSIAADEIETYIPHRSGRTGCAGKKQVLIVIITKSDLQVKFSSIERIIQMKFEKQFFCAEIAEITTRINRIKDRS
jgi:superfamily II DNA/RNA helicase